MKTIYRIILAVDYEGQREREMYYTEKREDAENRERTSRTQQYEKGYQAGVVDGNNKKKEVFDWGVRPSKEQAEALMKQFRIRIDYEE